MASYIPLTQGFVAIVDDEDFALVSQFKWCARVASNTVYASRKANGKQISLHRFLLGLTDPNVKADHRFGNGLDNRRENLRIATSGQNNANAGKTKKKRTSVMKGVYWDKRRLRWRVQIASGNGLKKHIGHFTDEVQAALAYDAAAKQRFGDFARTNF